MPKPKVAQKSPYVLDLEPGVYSWCGCGLSKTGPHCDNSHKGTEFEGSANAAFAFEIEGDEPKKVALCGCKQSNTPPYCDGTHKSL